MDKKSMKISLILLIGPYIVLTNSNFTDDAPPMAAPGSNFTDYQLLALQETNKYRRHHNVPELILSDELNGIAEYCAKYYVIHNDIDHSCKEVDKYGPFTLGENLWWGGGHTWTGLVAATKSTSGFYSEICDYTFGGGGEKQGQAGVGRVGHFTQVIWKDSRELGIGYYQALGSTVLVAIYRPRGNMGDDVEPANVLPGPDGPGKCLAECASSLSISPGFLVTTLSVILSLAL